MNKLTKEQAEWLIKELEEKAYNDCYSYCKVTTQEIIRQRTEDEEDKVNGLLAPHLKNWIAFKVLMDSVIDDAGVQLRRPMPDMQYFIKKFERYVLSTKEDEYKWGLHPLVLRQLYQYFDENHIPLDTDEQKAKDEMTEDDYYSSSAYDRRWPKDNSDKVNE